MTGAYSSTILRNWKANSFSVMVASPARQAQVDWTGILRCRSIASYIPCGVSLRLHTCFGSSTSSCSRYPCLGLVVMICQWLKFVFCFKGMHSSWCRLFFGNSHCCSLDLFSSRFEVGVDHLLQEPISSVDCVSAVHQISSAGIGMSGRQNHDPLEGGDDGRRSDRDDGAESGVAVAEVHPGIGRLGGRAAQSVIMWHRLSCRRQRNSRGTISNSRCPQAGELFPGGRLVVNFHDDLGWDRSRLFFGQSISLLTVTNMRRNFLITRGCECPHW